MGRGLLLLGEQGLDVVVDEDRPGFGAFGSRLVTHKPGMRSCNIGGTCTIQNPFASKSEMTDCKAVLACCTLSVHSIP